MIASIEQFRRQHNVHNTPIWNGLVSQYCKEHCWAMARAGDLYHAPAYFLNGWAEAVGMMTYQGEEGHNMCARLVWDVIGTSEDHKRVLLASNELAYGLIIHHYNFYLTIRGKQ